MLQSYIAQLEKEEQEQLYAAFYYIQADLLQQKVFYNIMGKKGFQIILYIYIFIHKNFIFFIY